MHLVRQLTAGISIALVCAAAQGATAFNLGVAERFSAFVFNDFSNGAGGGSDTLHSLAVGRNVTISGGYGFANSGTTYSTGAQDWALIVGGQMSWNSGLQVNSGNAAVGSLNPSNNPSSITMNSGGTAYTGSNAASAIASVDFSGTKTTLQNYSNTLKNTAATGTTSVQGTYIELTGIGSGVQYFNIKASDLNKSAIDSIKVSNVGSGMVVNIIGDITSLTVRALDSISIAGGSFDMNNTLWNFASNIMNITLDQGGYGSILATGATVTANGGNVMGAVVANNWSGTTQLNGGTKTSSSSSSSGGNKVPAPATISLIGLALTGIVVSRRRS